MKQGARCKHCGNYRVFLIDDSGAAVGSILCAVADACEPDTVAERASRQLAAGANARAMGRARGKQRPKM